MQNSEIQSKISLLLDNKVFLKSQVQSNDKLNLKSNLKLFIFVFIFHLSINNLLDNNSIFAQESNQENEEEISTSFQMGPILGYKAAFNAIPPIVGRKNDVGFSSLPDFGLRTKLELDEVNSFIFDVSYSTYQFQITDASLGIKYPHNANYLSFSPNLQLSNFTFGFNIGLPMSADINSVDFDIEKVNMLSEVNLGYNYEIYSDNDGSFNAFARVSYTLTPFMDNYAINDPLLNLIVTDPLFKFTNEYNPRIASVQLGFSYLFNL